LNYPIRRRHDRDPKPTEITITDRQAQIASPPNPRVARAEPIRQGLKTQRFIFRKEGKKK